MCCAETPTCPALKKRLVAAAAAAAVAAVAIAVLCRRRCRRCRRRRCCCPSCGTAAIRAAEGRDVSPEPEPEAADGGHSKLKESSTSASWRWGWGDAVPRRASSVDDSPGSTTTSPLVRHRISLTSHFRCLFDAFLLPLSGPPPLMLPIYSDPLFFPAHTTTKMRGGLDAVAESVWQWLGRGRLRLGVGQLADPTTHRGGASHTSEDRNALKL